MPGIRHIGQYPCNASTFVRTKYLALQLPSTLFSLAAATHLSSGPYPNEIRPLYGLCYILAVTGLLIISPRLFLKLRSWLWMFMSLTCTLAPFLGLLTHPHAPPSTYWVNYLPMVGVMLKCELVIFRVSGLDMTIQRP